MSDKRSLTKADQRLLGAALTASTEHAYDIEPASPAPGMPTEEEIARALWDAFHRAGRRIPPPYPGDGLSPFYSDAHFERDRLLFQAQAVLALIRPEFEAKDAEIEHYEAMIKTEQEAAIHWCGEAAKLNEQCLAAEAKLARAVEALNGLIEDFDQRVQCVGHCPDVAEREAIARARTASAAIRGEKT